MRWIEQMRQEMWPHLAGLARTALAQAPDDPRRQRALAHALGNSGLLQEAGEAAQGDGFPDRRAQHLLEAGDTAELIALCRRHLDGEPTHTHATYYLLMALGLSGDARETAPILDLERDLSVQPLAGMDAALLAEAADDILKAQSDLCRDPAGKATRFGLQSRQMLRESSVATEQLLRLVRAAIDRHVDLVCERGDHLARFIPERARLSAWAVVTDAAGYQAPHRHPTGRLSGVVYLQGIRRSEDGPYLGPLVVGDPGIEYAGRLPPWGLREIEPVPGRIVLFPSYTPHATRPAGAAGSRIAVAFDVVPA